MKNTLLLIIVLLTINVQAQSYQYVPMPTDTATWQMVVVRGYSGPPHYSISCDQRHFQFMLTGEDTIINGLSYKKVMRRVGSGGTVYIPNSSSGPCPLPIPQTVVAVGEGFEFGIREDNKKVYISRNPTQAILDFNLQVGEQANYIGKIVSIDTVNIGGTLRKRFIGESGVGAGDTAIEGIGYIRKGIDPGQYFPVSFNDCRLTCHTHKGNELYNFNSNSCTVIYPAFPQGISDVGETFNNNIYPNPFIDKLNITVDKQCKAVLYNSVGILVATYNVEKNTTVTTSGLPGGLYLLVLKDKTGSTIQVKKLLKQ